MTARWVGRADTLHLLWLQWSCYSWEQSYLLVRLRCLNLLARPVTPHVPIAVPAQILHVHTPLHRVLSRCVTRWRRNGGAREDTRPCALAPIESRTFVTFAFTTVHSFCACGVWSSVVLACARASAQRPLRLGRVPASPTAHLEEWRHDAGACPDAPRRSERRLTRQ